MKINQQIKGILLFMTILTSGVLANGANKEPEFVDPSFVAPVVKKEKVKAKNAYRILCIGNSITRHGVSQYTIKKLKWYNEIGMAASCEENDYAHRLGALIQKTIPNRPVELYFANVNTLLAQKGTGPAINKNVPHPNLIIIQTGEHEGPGKTKAAIAKAYEAYLLKPCLQLSPCPFIICVGVWYPSDGKPYGGWVRTIDKAYVSACSKYSIPYVSVESLAMDPECRGWGQHPGVKWHPNDKGMKGYAKLLFEAFTQIKK